MNTMCKMIVEYNVNGEIYYKVIECESCYSDEEGNLVLGVGNNMMTAMFNKNQWISCVEVKEEEDA